MSVKASYPNYTIAREDLALVTMIDITGTPFAIAVDQDGIRNLTGLLADVASELGQDMKEGAACN